MALVLDDLIHDYAKVTVESSKSPPAEETLYGTVVVYGGSQYVRLDGSDQLTPVATTAEAQDGERVSVLIKNHSATITGNYTSPAARTDDVRDVATKVSDFEIVIAKKVDAEELAAERARIDTLEAEDVSIKGTLTAAKADIDILQTSKLDASVADITYATIDSLDAEKAHVRDLEADYGDFKELSADRLAANEADIDDLRVKKLDATSADIRYANIDFANIGEAALRKIFADSGIIKDIVVQGGTVTGELVGVTIKGDLIEGNTIVAEKLVVKGTDGLYYKLNTDGVKVAAEQTQYNSLNGSVITAKSITADRVSVSDLVAFGATIGGFKIDSHSIYSGVKSSAANTTRGIFLGDDGQLAVGDANNYVKYYKDTDGTYKLAVVADSIEFKSTSMRVGGRNLLLDTAAFGSVPSPWTVSGGVLTCSQHTNNTSVMSAGEHGRQAARGAEVTFSYEVFIPSTLTFGTTNPYVGAQFCVTFSDGTAAQWLAGNFVTASTPIGRWVRFSRTYAIKDAPVRALYVEAYHRDVTGEIRYRNFKAEVGTLATDWSPAPEDTDAAIAAKASYKHAVRGYTDTFANVKALAAEGSRNTWSSWGSYAGISPGDTVQLRCPCSDRTEPAYILMTVESVTASGAVCVSHGLVDPNAEAASKAYTDSVAASIKVTTDSITSQVSSVRSLASLALGNRDNFCQLDPESCGRFGWSYDGSSATRWYSKAATRDQYASEWFAVKPGDRFRVTGQASSTARGVLASGGTEVGYVHVNFGFHVVEDTGSSQWYISRAAMSDASGTVGSIDWVFTVPSNVHKARVFMQCAAWGQYSGTLKVRDLCVSMVSALSASVTENTSKITQLDSKITAEVTERSALGTKVSQLEQTASGISSSVSSLTTKVDGIRVGSRNLLKDSGRTVSNANYAVVNYIPSEPLVAGETYTVSLCVTPGSDTSYFAPYVSSGYTNLGALTPSGTGRQVLSRTFTASYYSGRTPADGAAYAGVCVYAFPNGHTQKNTIHWIKIERGNTATDWTPAPEDAEESYASKALATELSSRIDQTNASITDSISRKTTEITALQSAVSGVKGDVGAVSERVSVVEASFRRSMDSSGNPVLDLLTSANSFAARFTNQKLAFLDAGQEVASISNKKLYIDQAEVTGQLQIGDYAWVHRSGHMSLKYVGS